MARGTCTFRQRDVTAAIKAAMAAGVDIIGVEITTDGRITIKVAKPVHAAPANDNANPWDRVLP